MMAAAIRHGCVVAAFALVAARSAYECARRVDADGKVCACKSRRFEAVECWLTMRMNRSTGPRWIQQGFVWFWGIGRLRWTR